MILHVLILVYCSHGFTVFRTKLEDLSHFDSAGMFHRSSAYRARIAFRQILDICNDIAFIVSAVVYIFQVIVFPACSGTEIFLSRQLAVHYYRAVMELRRTRESAYAACNFTHLFFICEFYGMLWYIQRIHQLRHIEFSVASHESCHISVLLAVIVICHEQKSFHRLLFLYTQECRYVFYSLCSRSFNFLQRKLLYIILRLRIGTFSSFNGSCHITFLTVGDLAFAHLGYRSELMGITSAYGSRICFHRSECKAASCEYPVICIVHILVALVQAFEVPVEGIRILHYEFSAPHETEPRSRFIPVLRLYLIKVCRQLSVRVDIVPDDISENLLVRRSQTEFSAVPVLESPQFRPIRIPSA